ncbi:pre-rRNA processing protein [Diplocarpon rosae]|nr:pre-rRNA processing protein [Diplocarpon rosae]
MVLQQEQAYSGRFRHVQVYLPEYGDILLGTATVPPVLVDIRNGHITGVDFLTDLKPGNVEGIRQVANDWLEGRLGKVRVLGKTNVSLKSGIFPLGSQSISESMVFEGNNLPAIPQYNITRLNFREVPVSTSGRRGMAAEVSLTLANNYPVKLTIPPLGFNILVQSCNVDDDYISLADATTSTIDALPYSYVTVNVGGIIRDLPKTLVQTCPDSHDSPLDLLLGKYVHGNDTTIFVRGSNAPDPDTPEWITKIISSVTIPIPFPGHSLDKVIKEFSLTDTKFFLPHSSAKPGSDDSNPQISGTIVVTAGLPKEMNFGINVTRVRANADVFYKEKKLGILNLHKWQKAQSERTEPKDGGIADLRIKSRIEKAPLTVTDDDILTEILMELLLGSRIELKVKAVVDVEMSTVLGDFVVKKLPAEGVVPVKPISKGGDFKKFKPQIGDLKILSTSKTSLNLQALINFTNPTEYSAQIPYLNIHILNNASIIGDATVQNTMVKPGINKNVLVLATWDPTRFGGEMAGNIGRELISQYISGFNTTLTFQTHQNSIPHQPELGVALRRFPIQIPTPRLATSDPHDKKPHFIDDATFHLFTSTATFTLISPLKHSPMYIENINATAFYNHTEP